jgi:hypothetical protein
MPLVYSDIEVSAKIVFTDPMMFKELSRELHEAYDRNDDYRAIRDTLPQIDALIERLEHMSIL